MRERHVQRTRMFEMFAEMRVLHEYYSESKGYAWMAVYRSYMFPVHRCVCQAVHWASAQCSANGRITGSHGAELAQDDQLLSGRQCPDEYVAQLEHAGPEPGPCQDC